MEESTFSKIPLGISSPLMATLAPSVNNGPKPRVKALKFCNQLANRVAIHLQDFFTAGEATMIGLKMDSGHGFLAPGV